MAHVDEKVARRYAKALFEGADSAAFDEISAALDAISEVLSAKDIREVLSGPTISIDEKQRLMTAIVDQIGPAAKQSISRLLELIIANGRVSAVPGIGKLFKKFVDEFRKVLEVEIVSASQLNEQERSDLTKRLRDKVPSEVATKLSFEWTVKPELLGGIQVKIGDRLVDGSVEGAIQKIARQLNN